MKRDWWDKATDLFEFFVVAAALVYCAVVVPYWFDKQDKKIELSDKRILEFEHRIQEVERKRFEIKVSKDK